MPQNNDETSSPMLEDVLIALQKTFSRLSEQTAGSKDKNKDEDKPLALITGDVAFDITMSVQPRATKGDWDSLSYTAKGEGISLRLSGKIGTDIRVRSDEASDMADKKGQD